jgi:spartin
MTETVLFSFPGITLTAPHSTPSTGFLVLTSSSQPTDWDPSHYDTYLRLQHTPDHTSVSHPTDVLIEAWRELSKTSARKFTLASEFGDVLISFPQLHQRIPQDDARIDLPSEARREMTWETIIREFEGEVDRFVSYRKNGYSLIDSPFTYSGNNKDSSPSKAAEAGYLKEIKPYDPRDYADEKAAGGRLVLVDEENGSEVGEVGGMKVHPIDVVPGSKGTSHIPPQPYQSTNLPPPVSDPVEITFPDNGETGAVTVRPADYLKDSSDPAYANSSLVQTAANATRLIVTTSTYISSAITSGARSFTTKTKPNTVPTTFTPSTHQRFQQLHSFSTTAAKFSSQTIGKVGHLAQNAGAKLAGKDQPRSRSAGAPANPGILNKSLIAFNTIAEGLEYAGKSLLTTSSTAATQVVGHKYGAEAEDVARSVTGSVKNVGLVYIDASGVSRRAVVKGVAKGMVVGRVSGGGEVVVNGGGGRSSPSGEKVDAAVWREGVGASPGQGKTEKMGIPGSGGEKYLPPSRTGTAGNGEHFSPPARTGTPGNGDQYFPPSKTSTAGNGAQHFPPPGRTGTPGNGEQYLPPSRTGSIGNGAQHFPPSRTGTPGNGEQYLPRSRTGSVGNGAQLFSPGSRTGTPGGGGGNGEQYLPPSRTATPGNGAQYFPQSRTGTTPSEQYLPPSRTATPAQYIPQPRPSLVPEKQGGIGSGVYRF